ncbi:MAG: alpha/beta hydrolase [Spirochaetes bacterium]|nr:alpha/beta hydrolase [Spirochaetota bacterium]
MIQKIRIVPAVLLLLGIAAGCSTLGMKTIPMAELKSRYANEQSKFITVEGTAVHYRDEGNGPVLLLLHGVCASLHTWDGWVNELKPHYRIIRIDNPGFGLTGPPAEKKYTPEHYVHLMDKFVTAMGLTRFSIAANSLGGYISWNYTLKYPQKVDKLILIDSVGYTQEMPFLLKFASFPLIRPFARYMMPRFMIHRAVGEVYGDSSKITQPVRDRYFELAMREGNKDAWVDIFLEMKKRSADPKVSEGIKDISRPTLVMWGNRDIWIPYTTVFPNWKKDLPNASFIVYDGVGHIPMEEIPVQTARDAHNFLSGKVQADMKSADARVKAR